jgi:hypothetical protein
MPLDPFFTSAEKKHYIQDAETQELWNKLMSMSYNERRAVINSWRPPYTRQQRIVKQKIAFMTTRIRRARIHTHRDKVFVKVDEEIRNGKRVARVGVLGGLHHLNRCSGGQKNHKSRSGTVRGPKLVSNQKYAKSHDR